MSCREILYTFPLILALLLSSPSNAQTAVSTTPTQNQLNVEKSANISVAFDADMNPSSINSNTFIVHGSQTGLHPGTYSYNSITRTVTFDPDSDFNIGEVVNVTLTTGIQDATGDPMPDPYIWSFNIVVNAESEGFAKTSRSLL